MTPTESRRLGRYLNDLRKQHGITARQAAATIGKSVRSVQNLECGNFSYPSRDLLLALANLYGLDADNTDAVLAFAGRYSEDLERLWRTSPEFRNDVRVLIQSTDYTDVTPAPSSVDTGNGHRATRKRAA